MIFTFCIKHIPISTLYNHVLIKSTNQLLQRGIYIIYKLQLCNVFNKYIPQYTFVCTSPRLQLC